MKENAFATLFILKENLYRIKIVAVHSTTDGRFVKYESNDYVALHNRQNIWIFEEIILRNGVEYGDVFDWSRKTVKSFWKLLVFFAYLICFPSDQVHMDIKNEGQPHFGRAKYIHGQ